MRSELRIPVGVVVAQEATHHAWQAFQWRPLEVHVDPPAGTGWIMLRQLTEATHYHAGRHEIVLHRKEVAGYAANLASGDPCVYVILRPCEDGAEPLEVHLVTLSPSEVQAYGEGGTEIIGSVAMQAEIVDILAAFVDAHFEPDTFVKRRRKAHDDTQDHTFGQEPIVELRSRMKAGKGGSTR